VAEGHYRVPGREAAHWTGHPGRLASNLAGQFGSATHAAEEPATEPGAAIAAIGPAAEPRPDHARHVARWLDLLRADRRAMSAAASKAQATADWLLMASTTGAAQVASSAVPQPLAPAAG